jgi:hypothetical protein
VYTRDFVPLTSFFWKDLLFLKRSKKIIRESQREGASPPLYNLFPPLLRKERGIKGVRLI